MCGKAQDLEAAVNQKIQTGGGDFMTGIRFFQHFDYVAAQTKSAPRPMRVHRETLQAGGEQAQELDAFYLGGCHACIIPSEASAAGPAAYE